LLTVRGKERAQGEEDVSKSGNGEELLSRRKGREGRNLFSRGEEREGERASNFRKGKRAPTIFCMRRRKGKRLEGKGKKKSDIVFRSKKRTASGRKKRKREDLSLFLAKGPGKKGEREFLEGKEEEKGLVLERGFVCGGGGGKRTDAPSPPKDRGPALSSAFQVEPPLETAMPSLPSGALEKRRGGSSLFYI